MTTGIRPVLLGAIVLGALSLLPAGPAEACSRGFLVFFREPGSTRMATRDAQILWDFDRFFRDRRYPDPASAGISCQPLTPGEWSVRIMGHADDPGTGDPCALSLARAHVVRARLAALGMPEGAMAVEAFGDRRKMVPTAAGASEVQNRHVALQVVPAGSVEDRSPFPRMRRPDPHACPEIGPPPPRPPS